VREDAFRLMVSGSRDWTDTQTIGNALAWASLNRPADAPRGALVVIHGDAAGADAIAEAYCLAHGIATIKHPADWEGPCRPECKPGHRKTRGGETYCPAAGVYRNADMVATHPHAALAFRAHRWSNGTNDAIRRLRAAKIPVRVYDRA
jgi:hypothetical protein